MTILSPLILVAVWACPVELERTDPGKTRAAIQTAARHQERGDYATAEALLRHALEGAAPEERLT